MAKKKVEIKMVSYGIYTAWDRASKNLPKIIKHTQEIPVTLDVEFGYTLLFRRAKGQTISFIMKHPPFCDENGDVHPDFTGEVIIGNF
ncbi:MAG: DUF3859 domain-containing protein [Rikenellaceae bacterium]